MTFGFPPDHWKFAQVTIGISHGFHKAKMVYVKLLAAAAKILAFGFG